MTTKTAKITSLKNLWYLLFSSTVKPFYNQVTCLSQLTSNCVDRVYICSSQTDLVNANNSNKVRKLWPI